MAASIDLSSFKNFKNIPANLLPGNKGDSNTMEDKTVNHDKVYRKDLVAEKERVSALLTIGKEFKCKDMADQAILEDWTEDQLREKVLAQIRNKQTEPISTVQTAFVGSPGEAQKGLIPARSPKYFDLFRGASFQSARESWGDFLKRVTLDIRNETHMEKIPSEGGFSVPVQYAATLLDESLEDEIVRPRATIWPMTAPTLAIPAWDSATHTSNLFGGFSGTWMAEGGTGTDQTGKLRLINLTANKLGIWTAASSELIQDGLNFETSLTDAIKKALSWFLDYAFLSGTGAGQPKGVLNSASLIVQAKETGQTAATILYENLSNMYARLHPSCHKRAVWLCNSSAIPQLLQLTLGIGTAGTHFPVLRETDGRFFIFGKEVLFTEKLPALGSEGDIILVDLSQYMIGMRSDVYLERSNAPGWHTDTLSYRILLRADGQGSWDKTITPKNGSTLSWVVTLAARS
jgi:HK97 family phage major capsid protein